MKRVVVVGPNSNTLWNLVMIMEDDVMFFCSHLLVIPSAVNNIAECRSDAFVDIHVVGTKYGAASALVLSSFFVS